jgi:hypothetical protein
MPPSVVLVCERSGDLESDKISFNQNQTEHRIRYLEVDADTGEEVASEDIVKRNWIDSTSRSLWRSCKTSPSNRPTPSRR